MVATSCLVMLGVPAGFGWKKITIAVEDDFEFWRGGRVAEGARLESVFILTGNGGSNPPLSAILYIFSVIHIF